MYFTGLLWNTLKQDRIGMSIATAEFAEESVLDILIPEATNIEVEEVLGSLSPRTDDARRSIIDSLPQRDILFFGTQALMSLIILYLTHS